MDERIVLPWRWILAALIVLRTPPKDGTPTVFTEYASNVWNQTDALFEEGRRRDDRRSRPSAASDGVELD